MEKNKSINYSEIWGLREEKYKWLEEHDLSSTDWKELNPSDPYYFFVPKNDKGFEQYKAFWQVNKIFPVNSVGVVTGRDDFVIDFDRDQLERRIRSFIESKEDNDYIKAIFHLKDKPASKWFVSDTRTKLQEDPNWQNYFTKILYRPFDERWIFYNPSLVERTRKEVMKNMLEPNLALMTMRQVALDLPYTHFLITDQISEARSFLSAKGVMLYFPLYLYNQKEQSEQNSLLEDNQSDNPQKTVNISYKLVEELVAAFQKEVSPEEIFYYIYAIFYSNTYRQKYQEFLKVDFPRVPFTKDYDLFVRLGKLGKKLVDLHLLRSPELNKPIVKFYGDGDNRVKIRNYQPVQSGANWQVANKLEETDGAVKINETQSFDGIAKPVWNYYVGGYQVLDKWLKDRTDRVLTSEDIKHYCQVATALAKTIEIQKKIDELYPEVEKSLIL